MLETINMNEKLNYQPLSAEEKVRRGILGRLYGPVASFKAPTRNGRKYSEDLWEKVFDNDIVKELFSRGGIPGELDHPDRDETCTEKIAIMMPEKPKKNKNGQLIGYFDILNTPCGKIAATLAKYGFQFGISSRGSGDTFTDYDGQESVDPDTYTLNAFDLVLVPACKEAVLQFTESYSNQSGTTLKKALNEALENANDSDREIMKETLDNLEIDYKSDVEKSAEDINNTAEKEEEVIEETIAADNNGADMIQELQEALKQNAELESQVKLLQEKLSVCYTKEARYATILEKTKSDLATINSNLDAEKANSAKLIENLDSKKAIISELNQEIKTLNENLDARFTEINKLNESIKAIKSSSTHLNESVDAKNTQIKKLQESIKTQRANFDKEIADMKKQNEKLNEGIQDAKKDSQLIKSEANAKITKCNQLVEKYKNIAKTAVDKYIESKAITLGIAKSEINKRLSEKYSFNDIDKVCEDLQRYKLNMRALPFDINTKKQIKMKVNESKAITDPAVSDNGVDDEIDEALSSFMN